MNCAIEENQFVPYFWHLVGDDSNLPLVEELIEKDRSLLQLKTLDGLGIERFFKWFPKNKVVDVIKKHLNPIFKER